jgi:threonine/homoserine/homoserine lactone efflux protein
LGFTLAGLIQIPLLALGLASLFRSSPLLSDLLRYTGAPYLIWRGIQLIRRSGSVMTVSTNTADLGAPPCVALRDGVVASLTNPKGLVFLLAFLPQFVDPLAGSVSRQLVVLCILMKLVALMVESGICFAAGGFGRFLARRSGFIVWQQRVTGAILIALGFRLLTMSGVGRR